NGRASRLTVLVTWTPRKAAVSSRRCTSVASCRANTSRTKAATCGEVLRARASSSALKRGGVGPGTFTNSRPPGDQNPPHLGQRRVFVLDELQAHLAQRHVLRGILEWQ